MVHEICVRNRGGSLSREAVKRSILAAATKGHALAVGALLPHCVYEDRALALVASCSAGHLDASVVLLETLPGRYVDQPLAVCAAKGFGGILRAILTQARDLAEISPLAACHARSIARAREHCRRIRCRDAV